MIICDKCENGADYPQKQNRIKQFRNSSGQHISLKAISQHKIQRVKKYKSDNCHDKCYFNWPEAARKLFGKHRINSPGADLPEKKNTPLKFYPPRLHLPFQKDYP